MHVQVEGSELDVMSSFPFNAHTIDVLSVERPPQALHHMFIARGYCVRAMLGHEIGDVLYVSRTARRGGEFLAARRFGSAQVAPCYSPKPLSTSVNPYIRESEWCTHYYRIGRSGRSKSASTEF